MSFDIFNSFASATLVTLTLAVASLIIGLFLAILFVVLEMNKMTVVRNSASILVTLLRGLPEILVVFLIYFGLNEFIELGAFVSGSLALGIIFAAYASQSLRGAIKAISLGQWESGVALGFSRPQTFIKIIMPQVWRHALPGLSNQWLVLLKDTALVSLIGVSDLMRQADLINASTHKPFTWYAMTALVYLAITLISQFFIKKLEYRFTRFERGNN